MTHQNRTAIVALIALLLCGAIFGFFFAWVCSTMWGLDAADPAVAIAAMQAMNASVRNAVFFPAFFLTPLVLLLAAWLARKDGRTASAVAFGGAALVYLCGGLILTMLVNVPMNETLADMSIPGEPDAARDIWQNYSAPWQVWNVIRTFFGGVALLLTGYGMMHLHGRTEPGAARS